MNETRRRNGWVIAVIIGMAVLALFLVLRPVNRSIEVSEQLSFRVPESYPRVRAVLVRKDATRAILEHKGMRLLDEQVRGIRVDTSHDDRPLVNALLGNSQSELDAEKLITVEVKDPYASTDRLELIQKASVEPQQMHVETRSTGRRGNITYYETSLQANPDGSETTMRLELAMGLQIRVPWLFSWRVPIDAQVSAKQQLQEQRDALLPLVAKSAREAIVLPELGRQAAIPKVAPAQLNR